MIAADVFEFLGDDDVVSVVAPQVPAEREEAVARAVGACPNRALHATT
jgi:ferredoxin